MRIFLGILQETHKERISWLLNQSITLPVEESVPQASTEYIPHQILNAPEFVHGCESTQLDLIKSYQKELQKAKDMRRIADMPSPDRLTASDLDLLSDLDFGDLYKQTLKGISDINYVDTKIKGDQFALAELFGNDSFALIKRIESVGIKNVQFSNEKIPGQQTSHFSQLFNQQPEERNTRVQITRTGQRGFSFLQPKKEALPDIEIFKNFAFQESTFTQRSIEEQILIFTSPVTQDNIFTQRLPFAVYSSLLQSIRVSGKKKHLKKVMAHLQQYVPTDSIAGHLVKDFIEICIEQTFPVMLGKQMKTLIQEGYQIEQEEFLLFTLYLNRCKGIQNDARRFLFMMNDSNSLQLEYMILQPFFMKFIRKKQGNDILKFFEQVRKNLKLNKAKRENPELALSQIKKDFYRGLISDLVDNSLFAPADIVYSELLTKEKMQIEVADYQLGLRIYSAQLNLERAESDFVKILEDSTASSEDYAMICSHLKLFTSDQQKEKITELLKLLFKSLQEKNIILNEYLLNDLVFLYVEMQMWKDIAQVLEHCTQENSRAQHQIISFVREQVFNLET